MYWYLQHNQCLSIKNTCRIQPTYISMGPYTHGSRATAQRANALRQHCIHVEWPYINEPTALPITRPIQIMTSAFQCQFNNTNKNELNQNQDQNRISVNQQLSIFWLKVMAFNATFNNVSFISGVSFIRVRGSLFVWWIVEIDTISEKNKMHKTIEWKTYKKNIYRND